jgi:hypothetical protein
MEELTSNRHSVSIEIQYLEERGYLASYQINEPAGSMEIEGTLTSYDTGRCVEYKFKPDYYSSIQAENYFDNNWEEIEDQIIEKFWDLKL